MEEIARLVAIGLCVAVGSAVQASCGLGLALVAMPGLILLEPRMMPGPMLSSSLLLSCFVLRREWGSLDRRGVGWALFGRGLGTVAIVLLLPNEVTGSMEPILGVMLLIGVVLTVQTRLALKPTPGTLSLAGIISGLMGTASAVGGPAMGLVYRGEEIARLRSTLAAFFIFGSILSLVALGVTGHYGRHEFFLSVVAISGVLLGRWLGGPILRAVSQKNLRHGVLIMATAGGLLALVKSW
jgi:uncharacterized membrane protein YfcA